MKALSSNHELTSRCRALRSEITARHKSLAEIMEMIHTASLVHDDVLDECSIRRGVLSVFLCH